VRLQVIKFAILFFYLNLLWKQAPISISGVQYW